MKAKKSGKSLKIKVKKALFEDIQKHSLNWTKKKKKEKK